MEIEIKPGDLIEFTPAQRKGIYKRALNEFEYWPCGPFLCNVLIAILCEVRPKVAERRQCESSQELAEEYFPEFWTAYTSRAEFRVVGDQQEIVYEPYASNDIGNNQRRDTLIEAMEILTNTKVYLP